LEEIFMLKHTVSTTRRTFFKYLGAGTAATALLGQDMLSAHATSTQFVTESNHEGAGINVLLAHGAYADASSWSKVIMLLQAKGYTVLAPEMPLSSLQDDIDVVRQAFASLSGPTILVGHSYAGAVITNVGVGASNLLSLVYTTAFAPEAGESIADINARFSAPPGASHVVPSYRKGYIWVDPAAFPNNFLQDVDKDEARVLAVVQKPATPAIFSAPSGTPAWKQVPSWCLISKYDRMINPDAERFMARRIGAKAYEVPSSHASPVSHPHDVVKLIVAASQKRH
jgi:pimeloyl-ACP methyl ester carboxylesterase